MAPWRPTPPDWRNRMSVDPNVRRGQACIAGRRVLVTVVLDNLAAGRTPEQILADYPSITVEEIPGGKAPPP